MPADSLVSMAQRACINNIGNNKHQIHDFGDVPYELIKPILLKMTPEQLYQHEKASPQIIGLDSKIWIKLIRHNIEKYHGNTGGPDPPENPRDWYKVYRKLLKQQDSQIAKDTEQLEATLNNIREQKAQKTSRKVELDIVKPPSGVNASKEVIRVTGSTRRLLKDIRPQRESDEAIAWRKEQSLLRDMGELPPLSKFRGTQRVGSGAPKTKSKLAQFKKEAKAMSRFHRPMNVPQSKIARPPIPNSSSLPSPTSSHKNLPSNPQSYKSEENGSTKAQHPPSRPTSSDRPVTSSTVIPPNFRPPPSIGLPQGQTSAPSGRPK